MRYVEPGTAASGRQPPPVDSGDPAADARAFRQCLGQFTTGVSVMTASSGRGRAGLTANSFASLSLDPPLVLFSLNRTSRSFEVFQEAESFAVNILATDQISVSQNFASKKDDKFEGIDWFAGQTGAPVLGGVVAYLECERHAMVDGGDHVILIGRVRHFARFDRQPLLYAQGRYAIAGDHPDLKPDRRPAQASAAPASEGWRSLPLVTLLYRANNYTTVHFEEHRRAEGLSVPQVRVLAGLYETPKQSLERLSSRMYLGDRDAKDAVADLVDRGYVEAGPEDTLSLTPAGRERREAISRRLLDFDREVLRGISDLEIQAARRVLCALIEKQL
jgi:flavin reductase (DIM6/NTAB) family NADH-FMN oxidoreductase RutF/DNA-binding MarR family transcriptional regulator